MDITIRSAQPDDEGAVVALWKASGLVVAHNDPVTDFSFALGQACSDVLVAVGGDNRVVGAVMVGHGRSSRVDLLLGIRPGSEG